MSDMAKITIPQILAYQSVEESEEKLMEEDIELHIMPIEYAKGKLRPLDFVKFYKHKTDNCSFDATDYQRNRFNTGR